MLFRSLWALMHNGRIEPDWVKWVQIFGVGLCLGRVRWRYGLEAAIILHFCFNVLSGWIVPSHLLLPH